MPLFTHYRLDAQAYDAAGHLIAGGDWMLGNQVYHISPLYCYFVGLLYSLAGAGPWPVRLAQVALGVGLVWLLFDTGRRLFGQRWAWLVGAVACFYGPFIFYEQHVLVATLAAFLNALLLWVAVVALQRPGAALWAWTGVGLVWGAGMVARPNTLLLLPALVFIAWRQGSKCPARLERGWKTMAFRLAPVALVVGVGLAVTAPFTIRNYVVADDLVFLQDKGGLNFYVGNGPHADGAFMVPPELGPAGNVLEQVSAFTRIAREEEGRKLKPSEVDRFWYGKTFAAIRAQPLRWAGLLVEKNWLFWSGRELPNNYDYEFTRGYNRALALPLVQFWLLAPLAFLGTLLLLFRGRPEERFVGLFNVILWGAVVLFFVLSRYRVPVLPGLMLSVVPAVQGLASAVRQRGWARLGTYCAVVVCMLVLALAPKLPKPADDEHFKLGYAWHRQGATGQAEEEYRRALEVNADNASAAKNLAVLLERMGRLEEALAQWRAVERQAKRNGWRGRLELALAQKARLEAVIAELTPPGH